MKKITEYESFDGKRFETEAACRSHEKSNCQFLLVGLTLEDITRAMEDGQGDIADALEVIGAKIARDRRDRGELKRKRGPKPLSTTSEQDSDQAQSGGVSTGDVSPPGTSNSYLSGRFAEGLL
jgi:hypothetical protein